MAASMPSTMVLRLNSSATVWSAALLIAARLGSSARSVAIVSVSDCWSLCLYVAPFSPGLSASISGFCASVLSEVRTGRP